MFLAIRSLRKARFRKKATIVQRKYWLSLSRLRQGDEPSPSVESAFGKDGVQVMIP
jgi:hypothetical protein